MTARCSQLRRVWNTSGDEVTRRCGADARDYLVVQRLILCALLGACVPGLGILLPLAMHLGSGTDGGTFDEARSLREDHPSTTCPSGSPYLWAVVLTSAVAVVCVEWIADEISVSLVRMRYARAELMASVAGSRDPLETTPENSHRPISEGWNARWSDGSPGACTAWWSRGTARSRGRGDGSRGRAREVGVGEAGEAKYAIVRRRIGGGGATVGTPVGGATEGTPAHVGASSLLFGAGEEDADVAGGVNVLEHRVRAVAKAEEDLRRVTTDPNTGRRGWIETAAAGMRVRRLSRPPLTARRAHSPRSSAPPAAPSSPSRGTRGCSRSRRRGRWLRDSAGDGSGSTGMDSTSAGPPPRAEPPPPPRDATPRDATPWRRRRRRRRAASSAVQAPGVIVHVSSRRSHRAAHRRRRVRRRRLRLVRRRLRRGRVGRHGRYGRYVVGSGVVRPERDARRGGARRGRRRAQLAESITRLPRRASCGTTSASARRAGSRGCGR